MDVALIERALKDADLILVLFYDRAGLEEILKAREQITTALMELRKVPTCELVEREVEAAVNAFIADRENAGLPTYISKSSWRNHIQAALTAAALWRKEHETQGRVITPATVEELDAILNAPEPDVEVLPDGSCRPLPTPKADFAIGDHVLKHTGDYQLEGEVRGVIMTKAGKVRYVVEHSPGFLHIYSATQIKEHTNG